MNLKTVGTSAFLLLVLACGGGGGGQGSSPGNLPPTPPRLALDPVSIGGQGVENCDYLTWSTGVLLTWSRRSGSDSYTYGKLNISNQGWGPEVELGPGQVVGSAQDAKLGLLVTMQRDYASYASLTPPDLGLSPNNYFSIGGDTPGIGVPTALGEGKALIPWCEYSGGASRIVKGEIFTPGSGWSQPFSIFPAPTNPFGWYYPPITIKDKSSSIHVFCQVSTYNYLPYKYGIVVRKWNSNTWSPVTELDALAEGTTTSLMVVNGPNNGLTVGWCRTLNNVTKFFLSNFDPARGWSSASQQPLAMSLFSNPTMNLTADGRLLLAWVERSNQQFTIKFVERNVSGQWGPTSSIVTRNSNQYEMDIPEISLTLSTDGNPLIAWTENQKDNVNPSYKLHRVYLAKQTLGAWSPPYPVDPQGIGDASGLRFRSDPSGNPVLLWKETQFTQGRSDRWSWYALCP